MIRVCFFTGDIQRTGGTERVTTIIANTLADRGYDVCILSIKYGAYSGFALNDGVRLFSLNMQGKSANLSDWLIIKRLRNHLKKLDIDYIIDVDVIQSFYSIPASVMLKAEVISWEHFNLSVNVGDVWQKFRRRCARWMASRYSAQIVALTDKDRAGYLSKYPWARRLVTIGNPMVARGAERSSLRSRNVLFIGRLTREKGIDLLLDAWKVVQSDRSDWSLTIVGDGDEESFNAMCDQAGGFRNVSFVGKTQDVRRYYLDSSIFVMTSRFEGFPMVLLEAKSFGLPIVSFDCETGPREIVKHNVDGILVEKENSISLAFALLDLMSNEAKRFSFGAEACRENRFDLGKTASCWQQLLH